MHDFKRCLHKDVIAKDVYKKTKESWKQPIEKNSLK